ncbi:MAG: M48 family metallopeptidase [Bacilli bacterium]|nr:M48 family metallopeptidase [Bacilli bacterium]MDD3305067.1 M48 family metallopeptidase [Bacilli bacterium]MDD4053488.1 M48 family metallopeptidase [Bacilli bacterium]MDD4411523.1 M48 family metallopeptidase [Bacilli bacterium]
MRYEIDGIFYDVKLQKKKIKNLYIRVKDNIIHINVPFLIHDNEVFKVLDENTSSLRGMIKRDSKQNDSLFLGQEVDIIVISNLKYPECINNNLYIKDRNKLDEAYKYLAKPIFQERLDYIYGLFEEKIPYPELKIRKMTSRWGVCNRKNNSVTLNLELIKWDIVYIDYVIIHELSHFVYFDHSKSFWETVSKYCPSYKILRKNLRE